MNKKIMLFLSLIAATGTITPSTTPDTDGYYAAMTNTVLAGTALGLFSGGAIGFLSGKIFNAFTGELNITQEISLENGTISITTWKPSLIRLAVQLACKGYWGKPLRHKLTNWTLEMLRQYNVPCHPEMIKTISRVTDYIGLLATAL